MSFLLGAATLAAATVTYLFFGAHGGAVSDKASDAAKSLFVAGAISMLVTIGLAFAAGAMWR